MSIRNFDLDPQTLGKLPLLQGGAGNKALRLYERADSVIVAFLREHTILLLRLALATVFIWFGALKVIGRTPVEGLVAETVFWVPAGVVIPAIGAGEIVIGVGLLLGIGLRVVLLLFLMQMLGTFLVFATQPAASFQDGNPLLLTTIGEFVVKNLVLIAAGLTVGASVRRSRSKY